MLSLAGGAALPAGARARQQAALTLALPSLPGTVSREEPGEEAVSASTALPQTDLTAGLLASLHAPAPPSLPGLVGSQRPGPRILALLARLPHLATFISCWEGVAGASAWASI